MEGFMEMLQSKVVFDFFHFYSHSKYFDKLFQDETELAFLISHFLKSSTIQLFEYIFYSKYKFLCFIMSYI